MTKLHKITHQDISESIRFLLDKGEVIEPSRPYLGMSQIGHACTNYLWMNFRWVKTPGYPQRTKRIFDRGHMEEPRITESLKRIKMNVVAGQVELSDFEGHLQGHIDGEIFLIDLAEDAVCEFKTMAEKYFLAAQKQGIKKGYYAYWVQAIMYMHYRNRNYALFIASNKNDERYYPEILDTDPVAARKFIERASAIINSPIPMEKVSERSDYFLCKSFKCPFFGPCHEDENFDKNCRTCRFSEPSVNMQWTCNFHNKQLIVKEQRLGCEDYKMLVC